MNNFADEIIRSRAKLVPSRPVLPEKKEAEEGGCGVIGFASSVKVPGRHIFRPVIQMHNRGNGKGGGIAAAGLDPAYLGVSPEVLKENYLLQVALLDKKVEGELEAKFIRPFFEIAHAEDVPTIGVMTTLVTSADVPADVVYTLTKALFENLDEFREQHPAFAGLTPEGMLRGLTAPLHEGATRYYLEAGLIEDDVTE